MSFHSLFVSIKKKAEMLEEGYIISIDTTGMQTTFAFREYEKIDPRKPLDESRAIEFSWNNCIEGEERRTARVPRLLDARDGRTPQKLTVKQWNPVI